jgi:hypothetical protein
MHLYAALRASACAFPPNDAFRSHRHLPLRVQLSSWQTAISKLQRRHVLIVHAAAAFQQQSIPGKGIGLVATRNIAAGSEVLWEPALIAFTTHTCTNVEEAYVLQDALLRLSNRQQATYNGLANSFEDQYPRVRRSAAQSQHAHVHDTLTVHH